MNFNELTRTELIAARRKCDASLLFFTRFWFRVLKGSKFITNWHHDEIAKELENIEAYELELLCINIPPRHSKTELAAVNTIARGIGMNPSSNWLYITASDELRAQTSVSIRDIVSHPYFKIMYNVELKKDQNAKNLWRTTQGGGLKTATIFGQITGFGAGQMIEADETAEYIRNFEGAIVLDDINKTDDSQVENAMNEKVTRTLFNTIFSRKNSKDTPIINIQQRVGESDATAKLMDFYGDNPKAKFLVYPVLHEGKPLWEFKHTIEDINALRTSVHTAHIFETQYQQNPQDISGKLLPMKDLMFAEIKEEPIANIAFCDPADQGGDKLSTIFCKIYYFEEKFRVFVYDVLHNTDGIEAGSSRVLDRVKEYGVDEIFVETNGVGLALAIELKRQLPEATKLTNTHAKDPKEVRILRGYEAVKQYFIFKEGYEDNREYKTYLSDLTGFKREGQNLHKKDAIDVTTYAANTLKIRYRALLYK